MNYNVNFEEEADKLISLFKELEEVIKNECKRYAIDTNEKNISFLINELSKKSNIVKRNKDDLDLIRNVRNINVHQQIEKYKYVIYPNPEINKKLEKIINEIKNPPKIYDSKICIKRSNMYCRSLSDGVYETIEEMTEKLYTHIPIIENGKLIGVFSENTLLDIVKRDNGIIIDENTTFNDIKENLKIENHTREEFKFISKRKNVYDVEDMFKNYFGQHKRIGCIYITENGKENENILGMLTAWDVLGN